MESVVAEPKRPGTRDYQLAATRTRMCVITRTRAHANQLIRLVIASDSQGTPRLVIDHRRNLPGRGMWVSPSVAVLEAVLLRRAYRFALKVSADVDTSAIAAAIEAWPEDALRAGISAQSLKEAADGHTRNKKDRTLMSTR